MNLKTFLFTAFLCISFPLLSSCSDDDDTVEEENATGCNYFDEEYEDVAAALNTFSENPTTANCEAYKAALISFYEDFQDCPYWGTTYQEAVDEIQQMDCSEVGGNEE